MKDGFTLVETLVVVAITLFLTGVLLAYNRSSDSQIVLAAEQAHVTGVLYRARAFALQKNIKSGDVAACAFGVHFEKPRRLVLFQDLPADPTDCATANKTFDVGEELEETILSPKVELDSFSQNPSGDTTDVLFEAPYLAVTGDGVVTISLVGATDTREVEISAGGVVTSL